MIARTAGTTSSIGLSGVRTTWGDASSGSQRAIGSSSATSPSSTRSISAAAVIGFVIDAMRTIESAPTSPTAPISTSSPRATSPRRPARRRVREPARGAPREPPSRAQTLETAETHLIEPASSPPDIGQCAVEVASAGHRWRITPFKSGCPRGWVTETRTTVATAPHCLRLRLRRLARPKCVSAAARSPASH